MWHTQRRNIMQTAFWWGNLKERDHLEDQGVGMRIMLKWILNRMGGLWKTYGSGQGQVVAYCESISPIELSSFIKCEEFF
jgi:hypothetical protein